MPDKEAIKRSNKQNFNMRENTDINVIYTNFMLPIKYYNIKL